MLNFFRAVYFLTLITFCQLSLTATQAQSTPLRAGNANAQSFDEGWLFKRYGLQPDGSRVDEPTGLEQSTQTEADWQPVDLPHDWAITGPFRIELEGGTGKLPWKGIGWYRKHFTVNRKDAGQQLFIDFDGAMANAKVWLNGQYIGEWPYGYSSFRLNLTPHLRFGADNVIAVRLDTENWDSRWYPGAGIYRHVWLVKTQAVHVDHWGTNITTPTVTDQSADVHIETTLKNEGQKPAQAQVQTFIYECSKGYHAGQQVGASTAQKMTIGAGQSQPAAATIPLSHPKRWELEKPNLYLAKTIVSINGKVADTYYTRFGVRTLAFTARDGFQLNGKRVDIKGTCNHHDLGALGAAFNKSALVRQLKLLQEMGCNALRTSHNPPDPALLELADEMGFLVWDEAFDAWKHGKRKRDYNLLFDQWHEKDLVAMVHRDRNHPSVFIWSIGNEVLEQQDVALTSHLADIVRREDSTRPVSNGYNDPDGGRASGAVVGLDIMGVNYFFGQQPKWDADPRYANKPTIGSETSSCVSSRGEYFFDKHYKNWQITSYDAAWPGWGCSPDEQFRTQARYPHLLGEFVWTGFDYLGEPTPYNSDETNLLNFRTDPAKKALLERQLDSLRKTKPPARSSYFGIIDLAGFPKDRYYLYQAHWRPELPMAHLLPHWNWEERKDSIVPVHVYTSGDEAELFLNGKSLGRKKKELSKDYRLVWDKVIYEPGTLQVVAYKNGQPWATDQVVTTGKAAKLSLTANMAQLVNDGQELAFITLRVLDHEGNLVPRSHPEIQFDIEGPGEIVATDNGDATSFASFQSHQRTAYNGMALVIVRAKKGARGVIKVKASGTGLSGAGAMIKLQEIKSIR